MCLLFTGQRFVIPFSAPVSQALTCVTSVLPGTPSLCLSDCRVPATCQAHTQHKDTEERLSPFWAAAGLNVGLLRETATAPQLSSLCEGQALRAHKHRVDCRQSVRRGTLRFALQQSPQSQSDEDLVISVVDAIARGQECDGGLRCH